MNNEWIYCSNRLINHSYYILCVLQFITYHTQKDRNDKDTYRSGYTKFLYKYK